MLHDAVRQSLGPGIRVADEHLTCLVVVLMLLTGSDYSRGLPRIGPRKLWDALHVAVPALLTVSSRDPDTGHFALDVQRTVDVFFVEIYRAEFAKHVGGVASDDGYDRLLEALMGSGLSERVRESLPSRARLETTVRNINWVVGYWLCRNKCPEAPLDGSCGFVPSERGAGVSFADLV
tara:strand:+ start:193 stop:726 length:534 start_codon:yes stop_codon:yes gene_type:complete